MTKETYQEIKRISGEELSVMLSDLENVFDLGTDSLIASNDLAKEDYSFGNY